MMVWIAAAGFAKDRQRRRRTLSHFDRALCQSLSIAASSIIMASRFLGLVGAENDPLRP
jgi:hypothetical protein